MCIPLSYSKVSHYPILIFSCSLALKFQVTFVLVLNDNLFLSHDSPSRSGIILLISSMSRSRLSTQPSLSPSFLQLLPLQLSLACDLESSSVYFYVTCLVAMDRVSPSSPLSRSSLTPLFPLTRVHWHYGIKSTDSTRVLCI